VLTALLGGWIGLNLLIGVLGYPQLDTPPFPVLGFTLSVASLYVVILILAAQRQEDQLAQLREQLTLELALLGEQKTAKVIQLLEEFRRDIHSFTTGWTSKQTQWLNPPTRGVCSMPSKKLTRKQRRSAARHKLDLPHRARPTMSPSVTAPFDAW
jgi:uncharacterized membrane protein